MKKMHVVSVCAVLILVISCAAMCMGCGIFSACEDDNKEPPTYTVQYTDDTGTHQVSVTKGEVWKIEEIPEKFGYTFTGLFDAETGGTQYVNAQGSSLSAFTDKKNLVLFPQFAPIEYTVLLDYGDASVTGSRSIKVNYDADIAELPKNLTVQYKDFKGWYTEPNCGGTQIADAYGMVPQNAKLTEKTFDLSDPDGNVTLYAGFTWVKYTVTFYFGGSTPSEEMQVEHGTPVKNVCPETRVDGKAVLSWSESQGGAEWNGTITGGKVLYAKEWAPYIGFDTAGGDKQNPVIAQAGASIELPVPTRKNYKFLRWETQSGSTYTATTMPSTSLTVKAVWQAMLVFNENGGTDVADISVAAGQTVTLPAPTREGYFFAGWYTEAKEKYTATQMPSEGMALKAGWYKAKTEVKVILAGNETMQCTSNKWTMVSSLTMDFSKFLPDDFNDTVTLLVKYKAKHKRGSSQDPKKVAIGFYSKSSVSSEYLLKSASTSHSTSDYSSEKVQFNAKLQGNKVYVAIASDGFTNYLMGNSEYGGVFSDISVSITYPLTAKLYV